MLVSKDAFDAAFRQGELGTDPLAVGLTVTDLGPQPLRGLDEPITLYQVLPTSLARRTFDDLRLDVDKGTEHASASEMHDTLSTHP